MATPCLREGNYEDLACVQVRSPDEAHGGGGLKAELDGALGSAELDDGELALLLHQELNAPSQRRRTREMRLSSLVPTSSADSMTLEASRTSLTL